MERVNQQEAERIRKVLFDQNIPEQELDEIIRSVHSELYGRIDYSTLKDSLRRVAQTGDEFWVGWQSVYRDNIRDHIQHHFVREPSIRSLEGLLGKIDQDLTSVVKGYTVLSWYNQWTSTIIENIFTQHPRILPTV